MQCRRLCQRWQRKKTHAALVVDSLTFVWKLTLTIIPVFCWCIGLIELNYSFSVSILAMQVSLMYITRPGNLHNSCTPSTALCIGKSLLFVVLLVKLQYLLCMLHLSFKDPYILFWALPIPSKEVASMMWISLVM